jgi:hypothetical protein
MGSSTSARLRHLYGLTSRRKTLSSTRRISRNPDLCFLHFEGAGEGAEGVKRMPFAHFMVRPMLLESITHIR